MQTQDNTLTLRESGDQIVCRLRWTPTETCEFGGEIEYENITDSPIEIVYGMSVLEYLDLRVMNESNEVVSDHYYGSLYSPSLDNRVWIFLPRHKRIGTLSFFATVSEQNRLPGKYSVQAIYSYGPINAISEKIEFVVNGGT